jgi:hypothetical protein
MPPELVPVDHDPFATSAAQPTLVPIDHDPFKAAGGPMTEEAARERDFKAIASAWQKPPSGPSLIGMAKAAWEGVTAPGRAVRGEFSPAPITPGELTEEDVFRQDMARKAEVEAAGKLAATTILGQAPGGIFGAPRGSLGMGFARPGQAGAATAPAMPVPMRQQLVEAGQRIDVPVPRYMVGGRIQQGIAAGLHNIPGAGDKLATAAEATEKALGRAAETVAEGFGTRSPAVAGSYAKDALAEWITTGSGKTAARVYDAVDNLVNPAVTTELNATRQAAQSIIDRRANARIPGDSAAVRTVADAIAAPIGLNYEGIKNLRSYLGEMTPDEIVASGFRSGEVKQLYGALTNDLRAATFNAGGQKALDAFTKANRIYESIASRREALTKITGAKGDAAPEAVFARLLAMAGSKSSADISRLVQARKAMGQEAWNEVASSVVSKLGRDPQGEFSIQRFLGPNGYSGLSPAGKALLFRSTGQDKLARALDDIAFVTNQIEEKLLQFYNPSGTGKSVTATGLVLGILHNPIKTLSTITGGTRIAALLSKPATAQATADWIKAYRNALIAPHLRSSAAYRRASEQLAGLIVRETGGNPSLLAAQLTGAAAVGNVE